MQQGVERTLKEKNGLEKMLAVDERCWGFKERMVRRCRAIWDLTR